MHPHQSDHDHDDLSQSAGEAPGYYEIMETAVRELLVERGMIDPGEIRRQIEVLDSRAHGSIQPSERGFWPTGARLVRSSASASTTTPSWSSSRIPRRCTTSSSA